MTPEGWRQTTYGQVMTETEDRAGDNTTLPVLSVTKTRGPMLASERFGKVMHGRDLGKYRVAWRDSVVADPMLLWDGSIGLQTVVNAGLVSPDYRVYKPGPAVDPEFLGYLVRSPLMQPHYQGGARGTNVRRNRIARSDFLGIPMLQPPLAEQRKIAAILSSVDDAIESTQAVIDQLGVVKKAMMAELLTRGLPGRHTRFKQTEIGEVPEEWEVVPLGQLAEVERGKFSHRPRNDPRFFGGEYPFVQTGDVAASGGRILRYSQTLNGEGIGVSRLFPAGTIVITIAANIGDTGIAMLPVAFPDSLVGIRVGPRLDNRFLELVLRTRKKPLEDAAPQNAQKNINLETLRPLPIQVPSSDEQRKLADLFDAVREREVAEGEMLERLRHAKTALMSVLLTGEVRVKPDETTT